AGRARHVELLGDLGQRADAHVLERRELDFFYFLRGDGARVWRRRAFFGGLLLFSRSISVHSCSNPSPVTAETGSTECSKTDSSSLSARIRSPRASLSIFVATIAAPSTTPVSQAHAWTSLLRPGCRESISSSQTTFFTG